MKSFFVSHYPTYEIRPSNTLEDIRQTSLDHEIYVSDPHIFCAVEVRDVIEDIISEGCIPTDWQESFIVNLYKGKGDALNRGNYRGLKLIEQVMKVLERVVEGLIRQRVEIDQMQCLHVWPWHYWCNFYCTSATGEALGCQQAALHGLRRPGESFWSSSTGCHLVGNAQTRNWRVAGASGPVHVQGCEKQGKSRRWVRVLGDAGFCVPGR